MRVVGAALIGPGGMWGPRIADAAARAPGLRLVTCYGRHAFVEKPIADTVADAERMRAAFAASGLVLAVGHGMRRLGAARRAKELVDEGVLGTVVLAEANWSLAVRLNPGAWRWYRERNGGGPLLQLGVHHAHTLAYLLGPIVRSADGASTLVLRRKDARDEVDFPQPDPLAEELGGFARAVRGDAQPETGAVEAIAAPRVIEEAL